MFILQAIADFGNWFWGIPILFLIVGGGIYIGIRLGFIQFRKFGYICSQTFGKMFAKAGEGKDHARIRNLHRRGRRARRCSQGDRFHQQIIGSIRRKPIPLARKFRAGGFS